MANYKPKRITLFAGHYGSGKTNIAVNFALKLKSEGYKCSLCNARFVKPIDTKMVEKASRHKLVVTLEENVLSGGFGEKVCNYMKDNQCTSTLLMVGIPDEYVEHGNVDQLRKDIGIDADSIIEKIKKAL